VTSLQARIEKLGVAAFTIPTDAPESDGTFEWDSTTIVVVHAHSGRQVGLGYTYSHRAVAVLIEDELAPVVQGRDVLDISGAWTAMQRRVRNLIQRGLTQMAISAVDVALWDLKARVLETSLIGLIGARREAVPVYGSGGFTSYSIDRMQEQLAGWVQDDIDAVKMKVGRDPSTDSDRVHAARKAIGDVAELFVDANSAYSAKQALEMSHRFADFGVSWFEEPVGSDDLEAMASLRDRFPAGMELAAGEYGETLGYFDRMLGAGSVDVIQADVTRCGGITGFLAVAALCEARDVPLSAHTAPQLDAHVCPAAATLRHAEYFHDHVRIEEMLFDGAIRPRDGALVADRSRAGMGLELKWPDAEPYLVHRSVS
jgi:L-alanine-DL-glutamate epimerase-like enolase superfamily enzyme